MSLSALTRNAVHVLPDGGLEEKLKLGRPLRVKLGIDVTSPDIHVGRGIPLQRMRAFQEEGHTGVLIVGDYTTRIGDPSGRSAERPVLSDEEIEHNAQTYLDQAMVILDRDRTEVRYNGEWLSKLSYAEVVRLARTITVARMLERDDFANRYRAGEPISVSELLYPLMQAYDSVAIEADVEKMSSSVGNNIPLTASPEEMFGRTMRVPDSMLADWYSLVWERELPEGVDPLEAKLALARFIVGRSWGEEAAREAEQHFTRVVREGRPPEEVPRVELPSTETTHLPALLVEHLGVPSTSEARRLISQGAVKVNGEVVREVDVPTATLDGALLQAGKRRFAETVVPSAI